VSLSGVHLVFIVLALAVALAAGVGGVAAWAARRDAAALAVGVLAFGAAGALAVYAPLFWRKVRRPKP
jgi:phage-related minor tail protein